MRSLTPTNVAALCSLFESYAGLGNTPDGLATKGQAAQSLGESVVEYKKDNDLGSDQGLPLQAFPAWIYSKGLGRAGATGASDWRQFANCCSAQIAGPSLTAKVDSDVLLRLEFTTKSGGLTCELSSF